MEFIKNTPEISREEIDSRIQSVLNKKPSDEKQKEILGEIISLMDLTTLNGNDTKQKVRSLCQKAIEVENPSLYIPKVAAICTYPNFTALVSNKLKGSGVKTAVVATSFPSGQTFREVKLLEVEKAINAGAEEIDMVISRGLFLEGEYKEVFDEIKAVKNACGKAHLKVILETGELENLTQVYRASKLALEAGADFIKTSTGKIKPAATETAFLVMTDAIKEHYEKTGIKTGIKPAGGISDAETALNFYTIVRENLGEEWLNNDLFRIGASRLLDNLVEMLKANS